MYCGVWSGYPDRIAPIYRSIWSRETVGHLKRGGASPATVSLDGVGSFAASMRRDGTVCEIERLELGARSHWGCLPSARLLTDDWRSIELDGQKLAARREAVPLFARAIVIADPDRMPRERVYIGLFGKGVRLYPLLYWPLLIPLVRRRRLPSQIYDPRLVIGMERPAPVRDSLVLRAAVAGLCLLATEYADCLEYQPDS